MAFQLDTSGRVATICGSATALDYYTWDRLPNDFTRGYIRALPWAELQPKQRPCGWCGQGAQDAAAKKSCRRHGHCTKAVRAERARLYPVKPVGFDHLAPETLARMIEDCARYCKGSGKGHWQESAKFGAELWKDRQFGLLRRFPPLALYLGDDGLIRIREAA